MPLPRILQAGPAFLKSIAASEFPTPASGTRCSWGPGYLVSVGYMDPGNWATDIAGGSKFGYALDGDPALEPDGYLAAIAVCVWVLLLGEIWHQMCRDYFSPRVNFCLWVLCEIAIAACDLAELL